MTPDYGAHERANSLERSFRTLRNALRLIVFSVGDCERADEPTPDVPCECPRCVAIAALAGEEGWRFEGKAAERQLSMPREAAIIHAWRHYFTRSAGAADGTSAPMDIILAKILFGDRGDAGQVTARDWYVATTIVQWLATNVGQCVLFDAGYQYVPKADS